MPIELKLTIDWILDLYKEKDNYSETEKELIENLACTVEHFEKSVQ